MTYAFVEDIAASWQHYAAFEAALAGTPPDGLLVHAAGPTDEGFRIIAIWANEDAWRKFRDERLGVDAEHFTRVPPVFRELWPAHVVIGAAT